MRNDADDYAGAKTPLREQAAPDQVRCSLAVNEKFRSQRVHGKVFVAASVQSADVVDPEMMADAIRNTGNQCNRATSMEQGKDPSKGEDYEVVCDGNIKYTVRWQDNDTALIVSGES